MSIKIILKKISALFSFNDISTAKEEKKLRNGIIEYVNYKKGYAFIKSKNHEKIFVHFNDVKIKLTKGKQLQFNLEKTPKGFKAVDIQEIEGQKK